MARKFARHTGGGFSPRLAAFRGTPVIERRETSPQSIYSQWKKGKSVIFPFLRSVWDKKAAASPFLREPYGKLGALAQKRGFACANAIFYCILNFTFYILHFTSIKRSFVALLLRMTKGARFARAGRQAETKHSSFHPQFYILHFTFQGDREGRGRVAYAARGDSSADKKRAKGAVRRRKSGSAAGEIQNNKKGTGFKIIK